MFNCYINGVVLNFLLLIDFLRIVTMLFKLSVLVVTVFVLADVALSQQYPSQQQPSNFNAQGMTATQMWDPNTWAVPLYTAASKAWTDYLQKAQEASNQLYQQWEKTGAGNLLAIGMGYAQQAAALAQKGAEAAMNQAAAMTPREYYQN